MEYNEGVQQDKAPVLRIGISGKMRSGKDSTAAYLVDRYGFRRYAFADRLKEVAKELFGMPEGTKNRHLLVEFGRKMCEVDQMVWVNYVLGKMPLRGSVVISDLRFKYEYHALKAFGFVLVRVECGEDIRIKRLMKAGASADPALLHGKPETDLDYMPFDWTVNGTTYGTLQADADRLMAELGRRPLDDE